MQRYQHLKQIQTCRKQSGSSAALFNQNPAGGAVSPPAGVG